MSCGGLFGIGVPLGVHKVVVGDFDVHFARLSGVDGLDELGRCAAPQLVGAYLGAGEDNRAGGHDGTFAHLGVVHHHGAHAYEGEVVDFGAVDGHVVAYRHVVAYLDGRLLVERVQYAAVLDVHAVAYGDGVHVAAQHGVEPYAALVAHRHVAYHGGVFGKEAVAAHLGCEAAQGDD